MTTGIAALLYALPDRVNRIRVSIHQEIQSPNFLSINFGNQVDLVWRKPEVVQKDFYGLLNI